MRCPASASSRAPEALASPKDDLPVGAAGGSLRLVNSGLRGALAALIVNVEKPYRGSVWAIFTPADAAFYRQPVVTNSLRQVLTRMKRGIFLSEGGTEFFTLFPEQQFAAGRAW